MSTPLPPANRDRLLGGLAFRLGLVNRDQLAEAIARTNEGPSLAAVLAESGRLPPEDLDVLHRLAECHLARHGGDAGRALANLPVEATPLDILVLSPGTPHPPDELAGTLQRTGPYRGGPEGPASFELGAPAGLAAPEATGPLVIDPTLDRPMAASATLLPAPGGARYRRLRPHARGGLGEVFVALDVELNREVALKEIQGQYADYPDARSRFVHEAVVTGTLEHPGVVPVYGLGSDSAGRPYYAMRFIKGQSLHDAIQRFHRADAAPRDPGERELALRNLLNRFIAVCNAVGYAHSRGVIHRDLKPANVMLGEYGEALVVDWGLAKVVGQAEGASPERPLAVGSGASAATAMGQVVGTPSYMPPEQARGELDRIDGRSDVFALGGTLYCLLTGKAPYTGPDALARAGRAEVSPARQVNPRVPPALAAVCARAMAARPDDRYPTAGELAAEVERFLADEPVAAYRDPLRQRARRWAKRHQALVSASGALLLAGVVGLALGLWAVGAEQARTKQALEETQKAEALAKDNLSLARKAVDDCFGIAKNHPVLGQPHLRQVREVLLQQALPFYENFKQQTPDDLALRRESADQFARVGYIQAELGNREEGLRQYRRAEEEIRFLVKAEPSMSAHRTELAGTLAGMGVVQITLGRSDEALKSISEALSLRRELARESPTPAHFNAVAGTLTDLGALHAQRGRGDLALQCYSEARDLRRGMTGPNGGALLYPHFQARTLANLATFQADAGQLEQALRTYSEARDLHRALMKTQTGPRLLTIQFDLAGTLSSLGSVQRKLNLKPDALASFTEARSLQRLVVRKQPDVPDYQSALAGTLNNLANLHDDMGHPEEGLKVCRESCDLHRELVDAQPGVPGPLHMLARALSNLSRRQHARADLSAARASLTEACKLARQLSKSHPGVPEYQATLAAALGGLGRVQSDAGEAGPALRTYAEAAALGRNLVLAHPGVPAYQADLALALTNQGNILQALARPAQAIESYVEAAKVSRRLVAAHPELTDYRGAFAGTLTALAFLQRRGGRFEEALRTFSEAGEQARQTTRALPTPDHSVGLVQALLGRALIGRALGQPVGGREPLTTALTVLARLKKDHPSYPGVDTLLFHCHKERADLLSGLEDHRAALPDWERVVALAPAQAQTWARLRRARCHALVGEHDLAATAAAGLAGAASVPTAALYDIASALALAGAAARSDLGRPLPVRERQGEARARLAVALLGRAGTAGYFRQPANLTRLDSDRDLASLRDRADYRRFRDALPPAETKAH